MNEQEKIKDENEQLVFAIPRSYVQDFTETNFGKRLNEEEIEKLEDAFCGADDDTCGYVIDAVASSIRHALGIVI